MIVAKHRSLAQPSVGGVPELYGPKDMHRSLRALAQTLQHKFGERRLRPGAEMADHLGGGQRGDAAARGEIAAMRITVKEAGGVEIAGAGQIDDVVDRPGGNLMHLVGR